MNTESGNSFPENTVLVVGAGVSGVCAALQCARSGVRCLLIERSGINGGTLALSGIASPGLFFDWKGRQVIAGIGWELVHECVETCGDTLPAFTRYRAEDFWRFEIPVDPVVFTALCDEKLLAEGVEVRYHTMLAGLQRQGNSWRATVCEKDGLQKVVVRCVIDCTGDANAVVQAGGRVRIPPVCQPGTSSVICSGINRAQLIPEQMENDFRKEAAAGRIFPADLGWSKGYSDLFLSRNGTNANHINGINGGDSRGRSTMEICGRLALLRSYRFLKRQPGCENLHMQYAGLECGVRESRTIVGEATVTDESYRTGAPMADPIAYAFYPMDLHDAEEGILNTQLVPGALPSVPCGALLPAGQEGLLAAGRIISSTRKANAGLRIQAVCMATGQAAGAWAALAIRNDCPLRELPYEQLRAELLRCGAILPAVNTQSNHGNAGK